MKRDYRSKSTLFILVKGPFLGQELIGKGPFLSQERLQLGKDSSILGKVKGPFLSQERSSLQLGKLSAIFRKVRKVKGKERIQTLPNQKSVFSCQSTTQKNFWNPITLVMYFHNFFPELIMAASIPGIENFSWKSVCEVFFNMQNWNFRVAPKSERTGCVLVNSYEKLKNTTTTTQYEIERRQGEAQALLVV